MFKYFLCLCCFLVPHASALADSTRFAHHDDSFKGWTYEEIRYPNKYGNTSALTVKIRPGVDLDIMYSNEYVRYVEAQAICASTLLSRNDWRMPTEADLQLISKEDPNPYFKHTNGWVEGRKLFDREESGIKVEDASSSGSESRPVCISPAKKLTAKTSKKATSTNSTDHNLNILTSSRVEDEANAVAQKKQKIEGEKVRIASKNKEISEQTARARKQMADEAKNEAKTKGFCVAEIAAGRYPCGCAKYAPGGMKTCSK